VTDVIAVIAVIIAWIGLELTGHHDAAITLVVTLVAVDLLNWLRRRQARRRANIDAPAGQPMQTHRIQETVKLWHTPETVWSLIHPAENAPLLQPDVVRGYQVPGTPSGLGEQQAFVGLSGTTTVIEVVEYVERRQAVTNLISPKPPVPVRNVLALEPVSGGCILTFGQEYDGHSSQAMTPESVTQWRQQAQSYLDRVRTTLDRWKPNPPAT
jgi:hypothetical protein